MSYSFTVRAATKEAALQAVSDQLDQVVAAQPIHAADRQQAYASTEAFLEIVPAADGYCDSQRSRLGRLEAESGKLAEYHHVRWSRRRGAAGFSAR